MKLIILIIMVLSILMLVGCSQQKCEVCIEKECPELNCSEGPLLIKEVTIETTTHSYICPDYSEVNKKEDCIDADEDGWYEIKTMDGSNARKTESFKINSDRWRYRATCEGGAGFNLGLYNIDNPDWSIDSIYMGSCGEQEYNYIYSGSGEYFFDMGAFVDSWEIVVEAKK